MRTYDNRIKYYELLMKYDDIAKYKTYELPNGFHYEFYKPGDEQEWIQIHLESGEFTSIERGLKHFHDFYDSFIDELPKRCVFIVDDKTNEKIGTATISLLKQAKLITNIFSYYHLYPKIIKILLTGHSDLDILVDSINKCNLFQYIFKPFDGAIAYQDQLSTCGNPIR